ncbi:hypothetical protein L249_1495 [Ophiocordyceps polyrhachis-furcata BCC 54312]|uniref:Enoyl-CoA hydratase n=1 Tax=Ophiocordyceps polyrhachis-furcata BCC 54312 TaxID=1330021 RepID=A0A367L4C1_9HYPO|nr:hypothetical protein L249_1495 [Ophiocordyceps polyrhachis-furcata BCC 54312]
MADTPSTAPPLPGYSYEHFRITRPLDQGQQHWTAHVEIDRPRKLNAFVPGMWRELGDVFRRLGREAEVRAVVLSGAGPRAFSAGLDIGDAAAGPLSAPGGEGDAARRAWAFRREIEEFQGCVGEVERCEKPVICVLHGISFGLAIDIASCADIRLCSRETRFSVKEVDIGLAADIGTLARLPKIVGSTTWVKEVCFTGREFSASEALDVGFVSRVLDDKASAVDAGLALAAVLAEKSPVALQGTKELINRGRELSTAEALRYTAVWNSVALQTEDVAVAIGRVVGKGKKKAVFEKL